MKPGPRPKPTAERKLTGVKRPISKYEAMPDILNGLPLPPKYLSAEGKKEWCRMGSELIKLGLLTNIDLAAFEAYCICYERMIKAQVLLKKEGNLIRSSNNRLMQNRNLDISIKAMVEMRKWCSEFGMTPASKTGAHAVKPPEKSMLERLQEKKSKIRRVK